MKNANAQITTEDIAAFFAEWGDPNTGSDTRDMQAGFEGWCWDLRGETLVELKGGQSDLISLAEDIAYAVNQTQEWRGSVSAADAQKFVDEYRDELIEAIG